jgi:hypothetical protein
MIVPSKAKEIGTMTEMNATMMENATATMTQNRDGEQTSQFDLVEQLARKMSINLEDAKAALEAAGWNTLTATYLLEQEEFRRKQALNEVAESCVVKDNAAHESAAPGKAAKKAVARPRKNRQWLANLRDHIHRLLAFGNHNRFTVVRDGEQLLEMPVTALALLLLFSFGTCALLMAAGLFAGCRYTLTAVAEA